MPGAGSCKKGRPPRSFCPWRLAALLSPMLMVLALVSTFRGGNSSAPVWISPQEVSVKLPPSVFWSQRPARPSTRSLNLLLVGHELTLTGAPGSFLEVGQSLRDKGHNITFVFLKGGDLEQAVKEAGFTYSFIPNLRAHPRLHAPPVALAEYDAIICNTVVVHRWFRDQVEAWGLSFLRKLVWWIRELPVGPYALQTFTDGHDIQRYMLVRAAAVLCASDATRQWWEQWALQGAYTAGLDYSPVGMQQESFHRGQAQLPATLPSIMALRNPLPTWMWQAAGLHEQYECSRASVAWPHADLRREFRQRINATDADFVVLAVGTNEARKGTPQLVYAFAQAWLQSSRQQAAAGRTAGRMLLVGLGQRMPGLTVVVQQEWERMLYAAELAGDNVTALASSGQPFDGAVHLVDATGNHTARLGWYAAADVQVLNAECEAFGKVTVEGMAASLPLLATACGGSIEIVQNGVTGLLHPTPIAGAVSDVALAEHMLLLDRRTAAGRTLAQKMGEAGCRRVLAAFSPKQHFAAAEALVRQVADAAEAADAVAARGLSAEGLPSVAAALHPSGWSTAFMPEPAIQADVKAIDLQWAWQELPAAEVVAGKSSALQVGNMLHLLSDYTWDGQGQAIAAASTMRTLDLDAMQWLGSLAEAPAGMAVLRLAPDLGGSRYAYLVPGQNGGTCSPPVSAMYRFDLDAGQFEALPPLPQPRYSPSAMLLDDGRLHVFGGLQPDLATPARDHWSLKIDADGSTAAKWTVERQMPLHLGGAHATVMLLQPQDAAEPAVYYWGRVSQVFQLRNSSAGGDACVHDRHWGDASLWSFNAARGWRRHRDLPLPLQHASGCTLKLGHDTALVVGGQHYNGWLSRTMWLFNATDDSWTRVGYAPVYTKDSVCALHGGRLVMMLGLQGADAGLSPLNGTLSTRQFVAVLPTELQQLEMAAKQRKLKGSRKAANKADRHGKGKPRNAPP